MAAKTPARYTLDYEGHRFEVETASAGLGTIGRLFVAGQPVDEQKSKDAKIILNGGDLTVVVMLNWLDQIKQILAVPSGTDPRKADEESIAFAPPGSHAARMEKLALEHPSLYAARHVALAVGQALVGTLGIGALIWAFVQGLPPRIQAPLPDLPEIDLPDLAFLAPLKELWSTFNWLAPIVIAILVAISEFEKRRKRRRRESEVGGRGSKAASSAATPSVILNTLTRQGCHVERSETSRSLVRPSARGRDASLARSMTQVL